MKLLYTVKDSHGKPIFKVPVMVIDGSIIKRFGRQDCKITPIGGEGEFGVNYHNLEIIKNGN